MTSSSTKAAVTVAVPSFNQGRFLAQALDSIVNQSLELEIFVADGGSTDQSVDIIRSFESQLSGWRSRPDTGQAAAINECIARGSAPYVCWINSDDMLLPAGIATLRHALENEPSAAMAYGRAWNQKDSSGRRQAVWVEPFSVHRLAQRCIVSQPATLIRRSAWEAVGGLDETMYMAMDYDLWWRLYQRFGPLRFVDEVIAVNREHAATKTRRNRALHYREAMQVVRRHHGRVPIKWWLYQPYSVWFKALLP